MEAMAMQGYDPVLSTDDIALPNGSGPRSIDRTIYDRPSGLRWMRRTDRSLLPGPRSDTASKLLADAFSRHGAKRDIDFVEQADLRAQGRFMRVDVFFPIRKLVVEVDGPEHQTGSRPDNDGLRDAACMSCGYRVVRVAKSEVEADADACAAAILAGRRDHLSAYRVYLAERGRYGARRRPRLPDLRALFDPLDT